MRNAASARVLHGATSHWFVCSRVAAATALHFRRRVRISCRRWYRPSARQIREKDQRGRTCTLHVMPDPVPGIHDLILLYQSKTWMAGTSPATTELDLLLPLERAPADIASAKAIRPADTVDRRIGPALGLAHGFPLGANIENASAVGENTGAIGLGAGVENLHALNLRS